jgi:hypothetical protein
VRAERKVRPSAAPHEHPAHFEIEHAFKHDGRGEPRHLKQRVEIGAVAGRESDERAVVVGKREVAGRREDVARGVPRRSRASRTPECFEDVVDRRHRRRAFAQQLHGTFAEFLIDGPGHDEDVAAEIRRPLDRRETSRSQPRFHENDDPGDGG